MNKEIVNIINDWNPIKIYPLLEDEYYPEIKRILEFIVENENITANDLAVAVEIVKDNIQCLDIEYVYTSQENSYYVERIGKSYNYILKGKVVDLSNKIMKVGEIKIDVSNTTFPNDIYQDQFIEVKITRMDLY